MGVTSSCYGKQKYNLGSELLYFVRHFRPSNEIMHSISPACHASGVVSSSIKGKELK